MDAYRDLPSCNKKWLAGQSLIQFDDFPIETSTCTGIPTAMFGYRRVNGLYNGEESRTGCKLCLYGFMAHIFCV